MMRYSLSSGAVQHVVVGNFEDLSQAILSRLYKAGGHYQYAHDALQLSQGGTIALRGWQCREFMEDDDVPGDETLKPGDKHIIAAVVVSVDSEFRLRVFDANEERVILTEALGDLEHEAADLNKTIDVRERELNEAKSALFTNYSLADLLKAKIAKAQ